MFQMHHVLFLSSSHESCPYFTTAGHPSLVNFENIPKTLPSSLLLVLFVVSPTKNHEMTRERIPTLNSHILWIEANTTEILQTDHTRASFLL